MEARKVISITIALLMITTIVEAESGESTYKEVVNYLKKGQETNEKAVIPLYRVLNERIIDVPAKAQVSLEILVLGVITEKGLKALLHDLYSSIKTRRDFKYYTNPTNIYIYAFGSIEHYESGMGQWVAMLDSHSDTEPNISINKRQISQTLSLSEEKFGLSEDKRKQIFEEIVKVEDRSWTEAEEAYPIPDIFSPEYSNDIAKIQIEKQSQLQEELYEKYNNVLAESFGLTRKQLDEIALEGSMKDWVMPPMPE